MMRKLMSSRQTSFAVVGLAVMVVGFPVLYLLVEVAGLNPSSAKLVELGVSIQLNYIGNRTFTWRDRESGSWLGGLVRANLSRAGSAILSWAVFVALNNHFGVGYLFASAISVISAMGINYAASHYWVFRDPKTARRFSVPDLAMLTRLARIGGGIAATIMIWRLLGTTGLIYAGVLVFVAVMFFVAISSLWLSLYAWHSPEHMESVGFDTPQEPQNSFSIVIPVRDEAINVLRPTVQALVNQSHPDFEIILVVSGEDDEDTRLAAESLRDDNPGSIQVVYVTGRKNKPLALIAATPLCTKDVFSIFDAESIAAPDLLIHVDTKFVTSGADVVQAGVQLMNHDDSWYSLLNCLEYYRWFKSRLHWHANEGFITLGGNTVFIKREALQAVGGYDGNMLAEDAEIGGRLSVAGYKVAVAYDPKLSTREETPESVPSLVRQRRRWMQGFFQAYSKGDWRQLPTLRQRMLARYTLLMPAFQAASGLLIPVSFGAVFLVKVPTLLALATFLPIIPSLATMAADLVAMREFGRDFDLKITLKHRLQLVLGTMVYQSLLSAAAVSAAYRHLRGINVWDKTAHSGSHHKSEDTLTTSEESV